VVLCPQLAGADISPKRLILVLTGERETGIFVEGDAADQAELKGIA
jgi:hypothetical protein